IDMNVLIALPSKLEQPLKEGFYPFLCFGVAFGKTEQSTDPRHRRLLAAYRKRPRCRASGEGDELAPSHLLPSGQGSQPTTSLDPGLLVHHSKFSRPMAEMGHKRKFRS